MNRGPLSCDACIVRDRALCASLSAAELGALNAIGQRRTLARGESLSWAGDERLLCANLLRGLIKLSVSTADGREQIVGLAYPADFVGSPYPGDAGFTATALCETELCVFPRDRFAGFLAGHVSMERDLLRRTFESLEAARERMLTLARKAAGERVAGLLLDFAARADAARFDLPLTRGEMAELLGLTIETVSRQLGRFKACGAISLHGARGIAIRDRETLEAAAG